MDRADGDGDGCVSINVDLLSSHKRCNRLSEGAQESEAVRLQSSDAFWYIPKVSNCPLACIVIDNLEPSNPI
jgi:hypothetical protein